MSTYRYLKALLLAPLGLCAPSDLIAQVYKCSTISGEVEYQQEPCSGSSKHNEVLMPVNVKIVVA